MKMTRFLLLPALLLVASLPSLAKEGPVFEMRTYYANEGKLDALLTRFRDHTVALFEKHGMTNIGYFVPVENPDNKLVYFLSYPSREARKESWKAFGSDPDWKAAFAASKVNGKLVAKVESLFLNYTDYSPKVKIKKSSGEPRFFEMRIYTAADGMLPHLDNRFAKHTMKLFKKHGMTNVAYWHPMEDQEGHGSVLVYLLAYGNPSIHAMAWDGFRSDPKWKKVAAASTKKAGGPILVKNGVESVKLLPVDFSPIQ